MKVKKTNALRQLDRAKVPYTVETYDVSDGKIDGISVAEKTGRPPEQIFKTLVLTDGSQHIVALVPVEAHVDMKKIAKQIGAKKVDMLPLQQLTKVTGYERGGCSPIGMKKQLPTWIDERATQFESIIVSAGKVGMQVELPVQTLCTLTNATIRPIT